MRILLLSIFVIGSALTAQQGETLADRRLLNLVKDQERLIAQAGAQADADGMVPEASEQQIRQLAARWESFVNDNPDDVEGRILYGKFLRVFGEAESAVVQFLAADQLEPELPVVKQQLGNYYAEHGLYEEALKAFIQAVELAPQEAVYHYQLGELLYRYRWQMIEDAIFDRPTLDTQMLKAFRTAAELTPAELAIQMRYGEAFYDVEDPDWERAAAQFARCAELAENPVHFQTARLHQARVAAEQKKLAQARGFLEAVEMDAFRKSKAEVAQLIELTLTKKDSLSSGE